MKSITTIVVFVFVMLTFALTSYQGEVGELFFIFVFVTLGLGILSIALLWKLRKSSEQ